MYKTAVQIIINCASCEYLTVKFGAFFTLNCLKIDSID